MSFSSNTKEWLAAKRLRKNEEYLAIMCAVTSSIGTITLRKGRGIGVKYTTESYQVAKLIAKCAVKLYDVETELSIHETSSGKYGRSTVLSLFGNDVEKMLYDARLLSSNEYTAPVFADEFLRLYLRGAFLACGSVSDPSKSYHLEMVCRNESAAKTIEEYATRFNLDVKYTKRKDNHIAYLKDGESISDFLSVIGADEAVLEIENIRAYRDTRNYANRTRNCDMANIEKSNAAAMRQVSEIEFLLENSDADLPTHLHETAVVRLQNPHATLAELANLLCIGKSGANHRIQKLLQMAKTLREVQKK